MKWWLRGYTDDESRWGYHTVSESSNEERVLLEF